MKRKQYGVEYTLVLAIIEIESGYRWDASCKEGSTGYMQVINRMFKWVAKTLILTYWNYIDRGTKRRLIDAVVQSINDWLASLATDEKIIGGRVEFNESENSTSQLAAGIVRFHIYITPPSPMQKMDFVLEYDVSYLEALVAA